MNTNHNQSVDSAAEKLQRSQESKLEGGDVDQIADGINHDMTQRQGTVQRLNSADNVDASASAAKSSFVANMSHEIRTPLTTIVGMTEMLLDHESEKSKHDALQLIHQSCRHLATLVNDVLDLSKIEAGKLEADLTEVSPMEVIENMGESMGYRAAEKGLEFKVEYDTMIPATIETDAVRFRQVLFNLASNAVKFTEQGKVVVRCKMVETDSSHALQIEFEDTGIGFRDCEIDSLFDQFTQIDDSPTRSRDGLGLGLFISRKIVELLGGHLTAQKRENAGSVFTLELPVKDVKQRTMIDPAKSLSDANRPSKSSRVRSVGLRGRRILVAEDTRGIQLLLKRILTGSGAEVDMVADGRQAMERLAANDAENKSEYDILLFDMHMPRMSGYEAAVAIRECGKTTPIIALTASAMKGDREKCLNCGCDDYLTKPIDQQKLLDKIQAQLSK